MPDVNVLVNAFRSDASDHQLCHSWLQSVINGESRYGMSTQVLSGVVRVATHPKVFVQPSAINEVLEFCELIMSQPNCVLIQPGSRHWDIFSRLCKEANALGNLVPEAWYAALAIESGCEWITLDRDYARFAGLRRQRPS